MIWKTVLNSETDIVKLVVMIYRNGFAGDRATVVRDDFCEGRGEVGCRFFYRLGYFKHGQVCAAC